MGWANTRSFNPNVSAQPGLCLRYVEDGFGISHGTPTAQASWELAVGRGTAHVGDRNLPNATVPLYFSFFGDGHVVTYVPGQGFYSVNATLSGHQVFQSIDAVVKWLTRGGGTYLGWAEEVSRVRVIEFKSDAQPPLPDGRVSAAGTAKLLETMNVRNAPNTDSTNAPVATYVKDQTFNYDSYIDVNGYRWLSYISFGGVRRYVASKKLDNSETYVSGGV